MNFCNRCGKQFQTARTGGICSECAMRPAIHALPGWQCPGCGMNYAPHVQSCACSLRWTSSASLTMGDTHK